jgi:two-component system NtrC family sensor kinase
MEPHGEGVLRIETERHLKGNHIIVRFKDSGTGIPREDATKIFEPFFTTKKGKGIGLGLSVAYGIIQEHGGIIDVASDTGKGTTIQIIFPLRNDSVNPDFKEENNEHNKDTHS